jgi:putative redox protein
MVSRPFSFRSRRGLDLVGILDAPVAPPRGWAMFAHCFTCGKDSFAAARIARGLARMGIGVLRFDFAGVGESGGRLADSSFAADTDDLTAAANAMAAAGMAPQLLVGHSLGAAAALMAAGTLPDVRAVASLAAPSDVSHLLSRFDADALERVRRNGEAEVRLGARPFVIGRNFIDDLARHNLLQAVAMRRGALMIMHAPTDDVVGVEHASRLFLAARHPKSFVSLDGADHLLTRPKDAGFAADVIAAWAARYLPDMSGEPMDAEPVTGATAEETGGGLFQTRIRVGDLDFLADEPVSVGGLASGPGPFDLVCAGLAACTTMTLRLYARHKNIPLVRARAEVTHTRTKAASPADHFHRTLTLEGPLSAEHRARLVKIAERCPVDLALTRGSEVTVALNPATTPADPGETA